MAYQNQNGGLSNQQVASLINLLGQQPQANPTSSQFNPTYFSQLMGLVNQNSFQQPAQSNAQAPSPSSLKAYSIVRQVDDPSVIEAQEVNMGVCNVFPSTDGEYIYTKTWNKDGLIDTAVYVRQSESRSEQTTTDKCDDLEKRVAALETAVNKLKKQKATRPAKAVKPKTQPKAESHVEEVSQDE